MLTELIEEQIAEGEKFWFTEEGHLWIEDEGQRLVAQKVNARKLAIKELENRIKGYYFTCEWSGEFMSEDEDGNFDIVSSSHTPADGAEYYSEYIVTLYSKEGENLFSLGGLTFENDKIDNRELRLFQIEVADMVE